MKVAPVLLNVIVDSKPRTVRLTDVHLTPFITRNIISYGKLEHKGFKLVYVDGLRSLVYSKTGAVVFDVQMDNHVLVLQAGSKRWRKESHDVSMAVINEEASADADIEVQVGTLMQFTDVWLICHMIRLSV
uniref:AlNc14C23G2345 protein n=1 Tax=Albugo laibachii Nc14 TaxID=890382 RepID=F0W643_9STRA|nr:AlNc14C23G2345 [Albugo laibachii Nc14]|eukprot:CCA16585.1 AlNc14C23G2345 [Albugo laibachii Nc14]